MEKILELFVIFSVIFAVSGASTELNILRVDNCTSSKKSVIIETCEGRHEKFSLGFDIFRPLAKVNIQLNLFKIEGAEFKAIFKSRPIEWCAIAQGRTKASPLIKTFISNKISKLPETIRSCPLKGRLDLVNITVSRQVFAILPEATYRLQGRAYDGVDKEIFYFSVLFRVEDQKRT